MTGIKSILEIGKEVLPAASRGGNRTSIYKPELIQDVESAKEKRQIRNMFRKKLEKFISGTEQSKGDDTKIAEIRKAWNKYAPQVYVNTRVIVESNTSDEHQALATEFLAIMYEGQEPKTTKTKKIVVSSKK